MCTIIRTTAVTEAAGKMQRRERRAAAVRVYVRSRGSIRGDGSIGSHAGSDRLIGERDCGMTKRADTQCAQ